jgi:acid stress-induced BolA-like protein IbaG/YrbA
MKKRVKRINKYSLGDLIAALFEETRKVTTDRLEQKIIVYAALKDLLKNGIHTNHPVTLQA